MHKKSLLYLALISIVGIDSKVGKFMEKAGGALVSSTLQHKGSERLGQESDDNDDWRSTTTLLACGC